MSSVMFVFVPSTQTFREMIAFKTLGSLSLLGRPSIDHGAKVIRNLLIQQDVWLTENVSPCVRQWFQ